MWSVPSVWDSYVVFVALQEWNVNSTHQLLVEEEEEEEEEGV